MGKLVVTTTQSILVKRAQILCGIIIFQNVNIFYNFCLKNPLLALFLRIAILKIYMGVDFSILVNVTKISDLRVYNSKHVYSKLMAKGQLFLILY